MTVTTDDPATATAIRPFHIDIPNEKLDDLRRRIAATRWPSQELVATALRASSSRLCRPSVVTGWTSTTSGASRSG